MSYVLGVNAERDPALLVTDREVREMVYARKDSAARKCIQSGIRVASRDKYAFLRVSGCVCPCYSNAMCRVFARDAEQARKAPGANLFQSNQANAPDRVSADKFGVKIPGGTACTASGDIL